MIIDYIIEQAGDFILLTDLTYKPKIKKLNIQIITPSGKIINTTYSFRKINVFGKIALGVLENGFYVFNVGGIIKVIDFKFEVELTEVEKAYFRSRIEAESPSITKLKHFDFINLFRLKKQNKVN